MAGTVKLLVSKKLVPSLKSWDNPHIIFAPRTNPHAGIPFVEIGGGVRKPYLVVELSLLIVVSQGCADSKKEEYEDSSGSTSTAFTVNSVSPADNATGVSVTDNISVTFSSSLNSSGVDNQTLKLLDNGSAVSGNLTVSGTQLILDPTASLSYSTQHSIQLSGQVQSTGGTSLGDNQTWSFTTEAVPDTTAPTVQSYSPADNATNISTSDNISVTFSETISSSSISSTTFQVVDNASAAVSGSYSVDNATATFTPSAMLSPYFKHTVTLTSGITDAAGNALQSPPNWTFTTKNGVVQAADSEGMILLSGGEFQMGAVNESESDSDTSSNEFPVHTVTLSNRFYIQEHEVTVDNYTACVNAGSCNTTGVTYNSKCNYGSSGKGSYPMNCATYTQATDYTTWKTANGSKTFRLCTEAEWEFATRAGTTTKWWCGGDDCTLTNVAWYDSNSRTGTQAVKQKTANAWGLYDVHGNAWERVSDYYSGSYYNTVSSGVTNPTGPSTGNSRVVRGGGNSSEKKSLRSAKRWYKSPSGVSHSIGFRICADS